MMDARVIAIAGGIGSGKSVVQAILKAMGFSVYDCDVRAKEMMESDIEIINSIKNEICPQAVKCDHIDRRVLGSHVFNDPVSLEKLNTLVHGQVVKDFRKWREGKAISFVETAILCTSGLDKEVNEIWIVSAPEKLRISRVRSRNPHLSEFEILKRMEAQSKELDMLGKMNVNVIVNDGLSALLPQIEALLKEAAPM